MPISSPTEIANLGVWFDTSDDAAVVQSGDFMPQMLDKSGNGRHSSVLTGDFPVRNRILSPSRLSAAFWLNGNRGRFTFPGFFSAETAISAFAITFGTPNNLNGHWIYLGGGLNVVNDHFGSFNGDHLDRFGGTTRMSLNVPYGLPRNNQWNRSLLVRNGNSFFARINNVQTESVTSPISLDSFGSIGTYNWHGIIGEVGLYTRELTTQEQIDISDYLHAKWLVAPSTGGTARPVNPFTQQVIG